MGGLMTQVTHSQWGWLKSQAVFGGLIVVSAYDEFHWLLRGMATGGLWAMTLFFIFGVAAAGAAVWKSRELATRVGYSILYNTTTFQRMASIAGRALLCVALASTGHMVLMVLTLAVAFASQWVSRIARGAAVEDIRREAELSKGFVQ